MKLYTDEPSDIIRAMQTKDPFFDYLTSKNIPVFKKKKGGRVLDLGCGSGRNIVAAARLGLEVIGVDINEKALGIAKEYIEDAGVSKQVKFVHGDILKLKNGQFGYFDVVILQEVIEHVEDFQSMIDYAYAQLKKDGVLILTTPHNPFLWNVLDEYAEHIRRFTVPEIQGALSNFQITSLYTVGFPIRRIVEFTYDQLLRRQGKSHKASTFRKNRLFYWTYYILGSLIFHIDDYFKWTRRGTHLVVIARK